MVSVGLARILSWTKNNAQPAPLSAQARLMARQIRRLRHLWSAFLNKSGPDDLAALAKAFALPEDSALLAGSPSYKANLKRRNEPPGNWAALHFVLRSIVTSAELAQRDLPPNVAALWAYKLGLEVMMPHSRSDMLGAGGGKSKGELRLQRELCRFLVERGVHAFGKRFGPAEVDLLAFDPLSALVIETKIAKTPPNEAAFRRWLSQLLSYMDQEPLKNAGALVVYNMGHVPIITRGTRGRALLLKERLYVIPINLCGPTASAREDAIEVLESQEPRDLVVLRAPVRRSSARKSKKRVR
jgi:hypothetical protein